MKAISLWQPWALLVIRGFKQYETRSWSTAYRGTLVIHAAKRWTNEERAILQDFIEQFNLGFPYTELEQHPEWFGAALGAVDLVDVIPTEQLNHRKLSRAEKAFGNFEYGRYAWKLANPVIFPEPIACAGHQRLWDVGVECVNGFPDGLATVV